MRPQKFVFLVTQQFNSTSLPMQVLVTLQTPLLALRIRLAEQTLLLQTLRLVDRLEAVDRDRILRVCELRASEPAIAIALAALLSDAGDKSAADAILATALNAATPLTSDSRG